LRKRKDSSKIGKGEHKNKTRNTAVKGVKSEGPDEGKRSTNTKKGKGLQYKRVKKGES